MTPRLIDLTGRKFGRLRVIKRGENVGRNTAWICRCECGEERKVCASNLNYGHSTSCGCRSDEVRSARLKKHGLSRTPEYILWKTMRQRCMQPRVRNYDRYGGRGISVCERWNSFENFLADIGARPTPKHTLDRIDNDGNYEPGNCRWSTQKEQQTNRTGLRQVIFRGAQMSLGRAMEISGSTIPGVLARHRIDVGWDIEDALMRPVDVRCRRREG